MANIARTQVTLINEGAEVGAATALTTSAKYFDFAGKDDKMLILLANTEASAKTVTILAGNGLAGDTDSVSPNNLSVSVGASKTVAIRIDSAAYKFVSGDNKGAIGIKASATGVNANVIELP